MECEPPPLIGPLVGATEAIAWASLLDAMETENVSVAERPLVSVALTETLSDVAEVGAVPEKVSVAALNLSQVGSAEPLESVALYVRVSC